MRERIWLLIWLLAALLLGCLLGVLLLSAVAMASEATAEASPGTITYEFHGPKPGAFAHAKNAWNSIEAGQPKFIEARPSQRADVVVAGYDGACNSSVVGRYRPKAEAEYVLVNRCYMAEENTTPQRENYAHELGHVLDLSHTHGRSIMVADASKVPDGVWAPTTADARALAQEWR